MVEVLHESNRCLYCGLVLFAQRRRAITSQEPRGTAQKKITASAKGTRSVQVVRHDPAAKREEGILERTCAEELVNEEHGGVLTLPRLLLHNVKETLRFMDFER